MPKKPRSHACRWGCGRDTPNISKICDFCWDNRKSYVINSKGDYLPPSKRLLHPRSVAKNMAKQRYLKGTLKLPQKYSS